MSEGNLKSVLTVAISFPYNNVGVCREYVNQESITGMDDRRTYVAMNEPIIC